MTAAIPRTDPQPSTWFRKIVTGASYKTITPMRTHPPCRFAACLVAALLAGSGGTLLLQNCAFAADAPKPLDATKPLLDKTLVAWVSPANLTQRGGSVLTLIDKAEHFDAIVLGEVAQGKWMAGSDFFRRTQQDQDAYPTEPPDGKAFVQMAIAYRGNQVTTYRNARQYARYKISAPQSFKPGCKVLIGLRYIGGQGEVGFLAGAIDDVRIYRQALTGEQLAALKPNREDGHKSMPGPIAWWTFEDGSPAYANKAFGEAKLVGSARIVDGKLVRTGFLLNDQIG